jgi:hypothetical protein
MEFSEWWKEFYKARATGSPKVVEEYCARAAWEAALASWQSIVTEGIEAKFERECEKEFLENEKFE